MTRSLEVLGRRAFNVGARARPRGGVLLAWRFFVLRGAWRYEGRSSGPGDGGSGGANPSSLVSWILRGYGGPTAFVRPSPPPHGAGESLCFGTVVAVVTRENVLRVNRCCVLCLESNHMEEGTPSRAGKRRGRMACFAWATAVSRRASISTCACCILFF